MEKLMRFDAADFLRDEEDMELYLQACAEEGHSELMVAALGDVARARNMAALARDVGLSRKGLYKALSGEGNPSFATITKVAKAVGFQVRIVSARGTTAGDSVKRGANGKAITKRKVKKAG